NSSSREKYAWLHAEAFRKLWPRPMRRRSAVLDAPAPDVVGGTRWRFAGADARSRISTVASSVAWSRWATGAEPIGRASRSWMLRPAAWAGGAGSSRGVLHPRVRLNAVQPAKRMSTAYTFVARKRIITGRRLATAPAGSLVMAVMIGFSAPSTALPPST